VINLEDENARDGLNNNKDFNVEDDPISVDSFEEGDVTQS